MQKGTGPGGAARVRSDAVWSR